MAAERWDAGLPWVPRYLLTRRVPGPRRSRVWAMASPAAGGVETAARPAPLLCRHDGGVDGVWILSLALQRPALGHPEEIRFRGASRSPGLRQDSRSPPGARAHGRTLRCPGALTSTQSARGRCPYCASYARPAAAHRPSCQEPWSWPALRARHGPAPCAQTTPHPGPGVCAAGSPPPGGASRSPSRRRCRCAADRP